jgi:hypothetical protein
MAELEPRRARVLEQVVLQDEEQAWEPLPAVK